MEINMQFLKNINSWLGIYFGFWLIGYILSIILFYACAYFQLSVGLLLQSQQSLHFGFWLKIKSSSLQYYLIVGVIWTILAVVLDYFLIVKAFKPEDGYYKLDVCFYYAFRHSYSL